MAVYLALRYDKRRQNGKVLLLSLKKMVDTVVGPLYEYRLMDDDMPTDFSTYSSPRRDEKKTSSGREYSMLIAIFHLQSPIDATNVADLIRRPGSEHQGRVCSREAESMSRQDIKCLLFGAPMAHADARLGELCEQLRRSAVKRPVVQHAVIRRPRPPEGRR